MQTTCFHSVPGDRWAKSPFGEFRSDGGFGAPRFQSDAPDATQAGFTARAGGGSFAPGVVRLNPCFDGPQDA
jgi:hypothetical protein